MKNISNSELAIDKANDLCKLIEGAYGTRGTKVKVTVSVGVVLYPNHGKTFDELYHHGHQALYKIKKNNKNGVCLYDESLEISDGQLIK
ncbi:MAG: diguanylate cyclase domain-containing protein [Thomasclavelia ramosa]